MKKLNYKHTLAACMIGYIVLAVVNNFLPLLLLTFQQEFGIPLAKITLLVTITFAIQLTVDLLASLLVDKIGYKVATIVGQILAAIGFVLLTFLPNVIDPFAGITVAVAFYSFGGGLIEVVVSPIVEACNTDGNQTRMSFLQSFYCWGAVAVIGLSTLFFATVGIDKWRILALSFAAIPIFNSVFLALVPVAPLTAEGQKPSIKKLLMNKTFWLMFLFMVCAGAAEQSVAQWASFFAENGLGVDKTLGDVLGPMLFAACMGLSRLFYGKFGKKIKLENFMLVSGVLCVASYLVAALSPEPISALTAVGVTGFAVGIMWPGTYSISAKTVVGGGTAMFALLAFAGDIGCTLGPTIVGYISDSAGGNLGAGLLSATVFPAVLIVGLVLLLIRNKKNSRNNFEDIEK